MDSAYTKKSSQEQAVASWIDYLNQIRIDRLIGRLSEEQVNLEQARKTIHETIEIIALQSSGNGYTTLGSEEDCSGKETNDPIAMEIASSTIKLPQVLCMPYKIEHTLKELEEYTIEHFPCWKNSPWLKGALGIIFDSDHNFLLNGYKLHYDRKYGLITEKVQ